MQKQSFEQIIDSFDNHVSDFPSYVMLYNYDDVMVLYENPHFFVDSVVTYLSGTHNSNQKEIANFVVRKLPEQDYINYVERVADLYKQGKFDSQLMHNILFPPESSNQVIAENYKDEKVKTMLTEIKNNPKTSDRLRTKIEKVLAGNGD